MKWMVKRMVKGKQKAYQTGPQDLESVLLIRTDVAWKLILQRPDLCTMCKLAKYYFLHENFIKVL